MLQKTKMVRKALESLYTGRCDVIEHKKIKKRNGSTGFKDVKVMEDIPCRLSYKNIGSTTTVQEENKASRVNQVITLFLNTDIVINPGSKIVVTQNGRTVSYKKSGKASIHSNHQEIILELFDRWI